MARNVDNGQDVIDSRDVIARIAELREQRDDEEGDPPSDEDIEELRALEALAEEASGSPDWEHGETLIRDSYFRDYAQQLAEDIGAMPDTSAWPGRCIDWEQAADELQMDYFSVDFAGVTYWIRS